MRRTARKYWGGLLVFGLLIIPAYGSDTSGEWSTSPDVPFLDTVQAQNHALRTLSEVATIPAISLTAPLPVAAVAKPAAAPPRHTVRGSSASLVAPASTATDAYVTVGEGQTLWGIAQAHRVAVELLAAANGIGADDLIQVGQRLLIPGRAAGATPATRTAGAAAQPAQTAVRQFSVMVGQGETLWDIAQTYGVPVDAIVDANELPNGDLIRPGQRIVIPGGASDVPRRVTLSRSLSSAVSIAQSFVWPARGRVTSRFGWRWQRHHNGIDIGAPYGSPIYAAKAGRVTFAGWYYGYGLAVIIDHGDGVSTVYGHASKLLVRSGAIVEAGTLIASVGASGEVTGPHLHFEIRVNGRPLNPLKYL